MTAALPGGTLRARRVSLVGDPALRAAAFGRALTALVDEALCELTADLGAERLAVLALGSYAREELCPGSDVDVMLLHDGRQDVSAVADALWYPLWDAGFVLGHAVRTPKETLRLADRDLDTLTALLDARVVCGGLAGEAARLVGRARELAQRRREPLLARLRDAAVLRRLRPGPVAEILEPNLKDGAGGLRDLHALGWAGWALGAPGGLATLVARGYLQPPDLTALGHARAQLLDVRVALHRATGARTDVLALQDQDAVAAAVGACDADALVRDLAAATRRLAWIATDVWDRLAASSRGPGGRGGGGDRVLADGVVERDRRIAVAGDAVLDGSLVLRAAAVAARTELPFDRTSLTRLGQAGVPRWTAADRIAFLDLLRAGHRAVPVFEALDHEGALERILPEWPQVRSLPQRNAYHRFTVDRHLLETVAEAAALLDDPSGPDAAPAADCERPDVLLLGALLHDVGKGRPGDHAEIGARTAEALAARIGLDAPGAAALAWLVRDHLLMADTASRRDLGDPVTIARFATRVSDLERLRLLTLLTVADSRATGPAAWGPGKAALVRECYERTARWLVGEVERAMPELVEVPPELVGATGVAVHWEALEGGLLRCTVAAPDRPGLLAGVAGALTIEGFDVSSAAGHATGDGRAVEVFTGTDRFDRLSDPQRRERASETVRAVLEGTVPLADRLHAWIARYGRGSSPPAPARVEVALDESEDATVIEVFAPDGVGLLARVARVFAEQGFDVSVAKVATTGTMAVDVFYVRDQAGKVTDADRLERLGEALLDSLAVG
ncbi:MAG: ACT domain-containing protein [Actinobacteria bacterium]|nr:ACT domain-containing protein [Actinomycetota bacterium]